MATNRKHANSSEQRPFRSVSSLCIELSRTKQILTEWLEAGGDIGDLDWVAVEHNLEIADVGPALRLFFQATAVSLMRVTGDVTPHKHSQANSAGLVLSEKDGFSFPSEPLEVLIEKDWHLVHRGDFIVLPEGTAHGFRGKLSGSLYCLFLDSPRIDDSETEYLT